MRFDYLDIPHREGYFELPDYELYFRSFGSGDTVLLCLHGGPGSSCDVLAPLGQHGGEQVTVYMYDQFGSGRSDSPAAGDFDHYTVDSFRSEVEAVRRDIGAETVILYGVSWGGVLALEYALKYPEHLDGLILESTMHDVDQAISAIRTAREEELTDDELDTMLELESERQFGDPEYQKLAEKVYIERILRVDKPVWWEKNEYNTDAYGVMWGPSEFALTDNSRLSDWSVKDRLDDISCPTKVIVGEYDEIGPDISSDIADRIPNASLNVVEGASHAVLWDAPEVHAGIMAKFLCRFH